jgi:hypothetical protein
MRQKKSFLTVILMAFILCVLGMTGSAAEKGKVADEMIGSTGITWVPKVNYARLVLTIAGPDGTVVQKTFESGSTPYIDLASINSDGSYTYELRVIPVNAKKITRGFAEFKQSAEMNPHRETLTQTGYFHVQGGMIVTPSAQEDISRPMDIVHSDDVIIDGSLCVGNDCYSGLAFGFDTIVLMENNLRIFFDDTSTIQNYPRNDWRIICNDSTDGGGRYFAIEDATEVSNILVLEAGAPDNSLYVDSHGDVGINTSTPYYELHIVDGDSPCVRLDQDGSYGWTPQKWDLCGNESNFFIRDATHASKLPFRIEPDAPTDSIFVKSNGYVGFGTGAPGYPMELETTGLNAEFSMERTSGARAQMGAAASLTYFGARTDHEVRFQVNSDWRMKLNPTSNSRILQINDGVSATSGPYVDATGWYDNSSRELKENINSLTNDEALRALNELNPVKYNYKKNKKEARVGFIAEDVPELVAVNGRKHLKAMDIVAVLTKVVQKQQKFIGEQQRINAELKKKITELEKK